MSKSHPEARFRTPDDLCVTPRGPENLLIVGSCLTQGFGEHIKGLNPDVRTDFILINNFAALSEAPPRPVSDYDLQIVQIPLRAVVPEDRYMRLSHADSEGHARLFEDAASRLRVMLDAAMQWNARHGLLTFVSNFMLPQQNPLGKLLPRMDARNMTTMVRRLNDTIAEIVSEFRNAFVFDIDEIAANFGRKHFQDDVLWQINHGAPLGDVDHAQDQARIHPPEPASAQFPLKLGVVLSAWWFDICGMYRTARGLDAVKLVIVDLDDTIWRGVLAELDEITGSAIEGWPLGVVEALGFLKKRGVILAIASKNDESKIAEIWPRLLHGRLHMDDFAVRKINWSPKADNVAEILQAVNVLPGSTVFIDDNPVERAAVKAAFPAIRVLGDNLYGLRRVLLWAPELQVATISEESTRKTEMIQAQVNREDLRKKRSRDDFLSELGLRVSVAEIRNSHHARFPRSLELINKSNQFNTTGQRWTELDAAGFFASGGVLYVFEVQDKFTSYGLVGVAAVLGGRDFAQFVMSCRVFGMEIETAALSLIASRLSEGQNGTLTGRFTATAANAMAADLYLRAGFRESEPGTFSCPAQDVVPPQKHVEIAWAE